jgi:hypothetical protein
VTVTAPNPADPVWSAGAENATVQLSPAGWPMRACRAGVFTGLSLALAVAAHRLGGGGAPNDRVVIAAGVVLAAIAVMASGRERRGRFIGTTVIGSQLLLHTAFALTQPSSGPSQTTLWGRMLFCHHGAGALTAAQITAARAALGASASSVHLRATATGVAIDSSAHAVSAFAMWASMVLMLAAHLAAAAAMAWWLRRGERAVWAAAARVATRIASLVGPAPSLLIFTRHSAFSSGTNDIRPNRLWWASASSERGPPGRTVLVLS